jgi:hypothetical protein
MAKQLLACAAALALLSGAAVAQTTFESSRTTTVAPAAPVDTYSATKSEQSYSAGGAAVESKQSYKSGPMGSSTSSQSKVVNPDGSSEFTSRKESSGATGVPVVPQAGIGSSTSTTTTIER